MLKPGNYQHYKGKHYEVIGIAKHSETLEEMVVYKALYENETTPPSASLRGALWVRPLKMFIEDVIVEGKKMPRFKFLGE